MIKIKMKKIDEPVSDGYVEFVRKDTGEKCHIHLQMLSPDALLVFPDGHLEMQSRPSFNNFFPNGLITDELVINMTEMFSLLFQLDISYHSDYLSIKIFPAKM